jgi:conjugative transfer signal peptidase TraF
MVEGARIMKPRTVLLLASGIAVAALLVPVKPRLIWNATASAPIGFYWVSSRLDLARGDLVLAEPPRWVRPFAARRDYLPPHVPLVKRIAALSGDRVCAVANRIRINGRIVASQRERDARHRPLPLWHGCRTLRPDEVFLLMADVPASFDGRYFGPVTRQAILGTLRPLWTF